MEEAVGPRAAALGAGLASAGDVEVVRACVEGVPEGFRELLARYRTPAVRLAYQMLGDTEEAEDVAQEAFVRVFQSIRKFRGEASFSTWLYRIVANLCLAKRRRQRPVVELDAVREPRAPDSPSREVTEALVTRQVLAKLAPEQRVVLLLREQEGLSYREIGAALGEPVGTVRSRLSRARMVFRELWTRFSEDRAVSK